MIPTFGTETPLILDTTTVFVFKSISSILYNAVPSLSAKRFPIFKFKVSDILLIDE